MIKTWFTLSLLLLSSNAIAQQLTHYTAVRVQKAQSLMQNEQHTEAIQNLTSISTNNAYDKAFVARMLGVLYWQNGQVALATENLESAVSSGLLQDENAWVTQRMLADIYLSKQQFTEALQHYYSLLEAIPESQTVGDIWFRIAQAHYQIAEWEKVIPASKKHLASAPLERIPSLSLTLGAQMQLKDWDAAINTLNQLIVQEPHKVEWWRQLAGLQMQTNRHGEALDTLTLAKLNEIALTESDKRLMAQLYVKRGIPERAALEISELNDALTDIHLLVEQATYWQMAKEWQFAIDIWQKAAQLDPAYHWEVSQLLLQQGHFNQALATLNLVEGRDEQVALAKTRAYYKLGQFDNAIVEAKLANTIKPTPHAQSWITYLSQRRQQV
ncbi:tetratricopeptide repeat protein [Vibrio ulleungensis]|uniref:Tetratricopeptide repeat protein n=1 Tax=Vibrio ulleungensis TaxID=2807619 RepID=A0ABS2HM63_9VIBR|nr:tetratricopeptide repeat protein [Vibrio ulleungensis]MBM7036931.1 tetratricopeptide repeat protein [Vibrio ulleungensis]